MNYAIRPADQTPIICRKGIAGKNVVFLLNTLHNDSMTVEMWTEGDSPTSRRVNVHEYHASKGLSDAEEGSVADAFVKAWNVQNGIVLRKRLFKVSPHHHTQQKSANTSMRTGDIPSGPSEPIPVANNVHTLPGKDEAIEKFSQLITTAQASVSPEQLKQALADLKQEMADKIIVAVTKALLEALWK